MREFPAWNRPTVEWPDAVQLGQSQLRQILSIPSFAVELAQLTRSRCEQAASAIVGEMRRRVNPLDLATKQDVAVQSKLGRNRVSFVLKEFLEGQRSHDEALLASVRAELREELQSFAAALSDDLLAIDTWGSIDADRQRPAPRVEFVTSEDEIDGADDEWFVSRDDERIDLLDAEGPTRRRTRHRADE